MTEREPSQRPSLEAAQNAINTLFVGLSGWRKRWPIIPGDARFVHRCVYAFAGVSAEMVYLLKALIRILIVWK